MRVGELARRTGTTVRALRYYEAAGLVVPRRLSNGYREYEPVAERQVAQIRELMALGLTVEETRPFVESIAVDGDLCAAALATFRSTATTLQQRIGHLTAQRDALDARIDEAAREVVAAPPAFRNEPAALIGGPLPSLRFYATDGRPVDLGALGPGRTVVFVYPLTGRPGVDLPRGLLEVCGARGATDQAAWLRDHHAEILAAGAARVYGLSAQSTGYQRELVHRLQLPYPLIPDPKLTLAAATGLPTLAAGALYDRLTLIVSDDVVEHVFHPIPDPASHALEVMRWLTRLS
ncbi:MerR family transcriptional regulator [Actinoplanes sp. LDG1-06]|uniref:MerR family transcriptional regulator n=1 Tax=Paractinoplanes ovalisporus TaxID=2810368 RepID=A0ABS2AQ90_9ACTN|nr:MerR family transcriptional regulator [Actinoplanes ovalisporus]MBM2622027.1 MerR family transcriptional regulator [Actinoplanes ovalisporus]